MNNGIKLDLEGAVGTRNDENDSFGLAKVRTADGTDLYGYVARVFDDVVTFTVAWQPTNMNHVVTEEDFPVTVRIDSITRFRYLTGSEELPPIPSW